MAAGNLPPPQLEAIPPSHAYVASVSHGREARLRRLQSGGVKLELSAPAKDGTRRIHGVLDLSAERAIEGLMAIGELCRMVDEKGLPDAD
jgi:hypothetical protein